MGPNRLRYRLVDSDQSWSARRRRHRSDWLARTFPDIGDMHVVDLGGRLGTWHRATVRPARVTVVNLEQPPAVVPEWAHVEQADACDLPAAPHQGQLRPGLLELGAGARGRARTPASASPPPPAHWPTGTGCRRPTATSPSSHTGSRRACSSCRYDCAPRSPDAGRWGTSRPAATTPPSTRCSGPSCWTARRCATTSPTRHAGGAGVRPAEVTDRGAYRVGRRVRTGSARPSRCRAACRSPRPRSGCPGRWRAPGPAA